MAFPDYGPLKEIAQFTQDGFAQGSFLYKLFAGEITDTLALHYVGLTFALIGAVAIVFLKQFHNFKTIGSWTFILIVLLIGPKGAPVSGGAPGEKESSGFFLNIPLNNSNNPEGITYADVYAPQAVVIDIMSKIHKAIYLGFFDISDPSSPRARNLIADISAEDTKNMGSSLRERSDIRLEITTYARFCGNTDTLAYPLYDQGHNDNITNINNYLEGLNLSKDLQIPTNQLSKEATYQLQEEMFYAGELLDYYKDYNDIYRNIPGLTYPPFVIAYEDVNMLESTLTKSGVSAVQVQRAIDGFKTKDGEEFAEAWKSYIDFVIKKEDLVHGIKTGSTSSNFEVVAGSSNLQNDTPVFSAFIRDQTALDDIVITKQTPHMAGVTQKDVIENRLNGNARATQIDTSEGIFWGIGESKWHSQMIDGSLSATPISLGLITPALTELYASRENEGAGRLSQVADSPVLHVVTNCAQLHQMIYNHVKDAVIYQNAWPASSSPANFSISHEGGFSEMVSGAANTYLQYPYPAADNLNKAQSTINKMVQLKTLGYAYTDPSTKDKLNLLNHNTYKEVAAENIRLGIVADIYNTAVNSQNVFESAMFSDKGRKVAQMKTNAWGSDNVSQAIRQQATTESISKNLPNLAGGPMQEFASFIASIGTAISSQFQGIGAVAFIRFLQLMVAISIFFIIMCTPVLFMMGLIVPAHAPGVILTSIISVVALKAIPIGFTLVDAVMTNAMASYSILDFGMEDMSIMLYVTATAYTSITMVTFFLLFKAGDTQSVMNQMAALDNKANEIADSAATVVKGLAVAAGAAATAGVGGAIGAARAGGSLKNIGEAAIGQASEVFGARGAAAIPGAGNVAQEIKNSYREGGGQATVMQEIDDNNKDIDQKVSAINSSLKNDDLSDSDREAKIKERDDLLSRRKSYRQHLTGYADAQAEQKYRNITDGAQRYWAAERAEQGFEQAAKTQGMTTQEARRKVTDAQAQSAANSTLSSAVAAKQIEMNADVKIGDAEISPQAAKSIADGMSSGVSTVAQGSAERMAAVQKQAINQALDASTIDMMNNEVDGPGRKPIFKPFDRVMTDHEGNIKYDKDGNPLKETVTQDPLYDQGASVLKSQLRNDPELKASGLNIDSATYTKVTENIAAQELAAHAKGNMKLRVDERASEIMGYDEIARRSSSGKAKDLWVTPGEKGYEELREITGTGEGEAVSLFNMHMQNNKAALKAARDSAISHQTKLNNIEESVGLREPTEEGKSASVKKRNS